MQKDYYQILGVSHDANQNDIKKAFRKLAHEYHPDKQNGDEEKFKEINEAYQVLSNSQKRQQYDYGTRYSGFEDFSGFGGFTSFLNLGDILRDLFRQQSYAQQEQIIPINIDIDSKQALRGGTFARDNIRINIIPPQLTRKQKKELKKLNLI